MPISPLDAVAFGLVRSGCVPMPVRMGAVSFVPTTTVLGQQVMNELALAGSATPLATVDLAKVPPEMQAGANNTIGAHYKVAYWLAIASRVASHRAQQAGEGGDSQAYWKERATALYREAMTSSAKANALAATDKVPVFKPFVGSSDPAEIASVFDEGANKANVNGVPEVMILLKRIGSPHATEARQTEAAQESGLKTLGVSAAATVLGPDEAARLEALSRQGWKISVVEAVRPYAQDELDKAKQSIALYDEIKANVAILDRVQRSGVVLPAKSSEALEAGKKYLVLLAQPTDMFRKAVAFMSGGGGAYGAITDFLPIGKKAQEHAQWKRKQEQKDADRKRKQEEADDELVELERKIKKAKLLKEAKEAGVEVSGAFGVAPFAAAAVALGVTEGTVIVAAAVVAAVIVLAAYFAVTQYVQGQVAGGMVDVQGVLATCMSDPSLPPETREMCAREHARSVRNMPEGPEAMLWAGAVLAAIGVVAYFLGPFIREVSQTGASELRAYRSSRQASRQPVASANVAIDVRSRDGQFYAAEVVDGEVVGRGPFRASRRQAEADQSALFGSEGAF